jgi:hypothetical protein
LLRKCPKPIHLLSSNKTRMDSFPDTTCLARGNPKLGTQFVSWPNIRNIVVLLSPDALDTLDVLFMYSYTALYTVIVGY